MRRALLVGLGCGALAASLDAFVPALALPIRRLEYDLLFRHARARQPIDERLAVFLVDDKTLAGAGAYPIPRRLHAELLRGLAGARVGAAAWDFVFDLPGPDDAALAAAMGALPTVLAVGAARPDPRAAPEPEAAREALRGFAAGGAIEAGSWRVPEMRLTLQSAPAFLKAAAGAGHAATTVDEDGICRRVPLLVRAGGRVLPSFALAAAMRLLGVPPDDIALEGRAAVVGPKTLGSRARRVPLDAGGNALVALAPDWFDRLDHRSYLGQLESLREAPEEMADGLAGKLVFIGYSATAGSDFVAVPGGGFVPGVLVPAFLANAILTGGFLAEAPRGASRAAALLLPALLAALCAGRRPRLAAAATGAAVAALLALGWAAFALRGLFLPVAAPVAACLLSAAALGTLAHAREHARATRTSEVLSRFVSPALLEELESGGTRRALPTPRRAELTVLFVDLAGFTPFTEEQEPEVVSELLAGFYPMAMEELFRHKGTLDEFKGDGVLAYFGAPQPLADKELRAVRAAAAIRGRFAAMDAERVKRGGPPLGIRCGLATGFTAVGYFGGERHATYGVVGRAVNLAARIQGLGEPGDILLDRQTALRVEDSVRLARLEPVRLKGVAKPVELWRYEPGERVPLKLEA